MTRPGGSPCGGVNIALIAAVKRTQQYRAMRSRMAKPYATDSWYEGQLAFIVFDLHHNDDIVPDTACVPQAAFVLDQSSGALLAIHVVEYPTVIIDEAVME